MLLYLRAKELIIIISLRRDHHNLEQRVKGAKTFVSVRNVAFISYSFIFFIYDKCIPSLTLDICIYVITRNK